MPKPIKYDLAEIHTGMTILYPWIIDKREKRQMTINRVIYREGRGLQFIGHDPDGLSVTHMPHPDDRVTVWSVGPDAPEPGLWMSGRDFPFAEVMR